MIHIICTIWGTKYSTEYVKKLYRGISRNTTIPFKFTCFREPPELISAKFDVQPISGFTGDWYSKISLYNKDLYDPSDQIFFFDLDTVITGNLDDILSYSGNFIILQDFYHPTKFGSGLMSWKPEAVHHMWEKYKGEKLSRGDQGWSELHYPNADLWQEKYPEKIISYKVHIRRKEPVRPQHTQNPGTLETASIVCFHGKPPPHEVQEDWMAKCWR